MRQKGVNYRGAQESRPQESGPQENRLQEVRGQGQYPPGFQDMNKAWNSPAPPLNGGYGRGGGSRSPFSDTTSQNSLEESMGGGPPPPPPMAQYGQFQGNVDRGSANTAYAHLQGAQGVQGVQYAEPQHQRMMMLPPGGGGGRDRRDSSSPSSSRDSPVFANSPESEGSGLWGAVAGAGTALLGRMWGGGGGGGGGGERGWEGDKFENMSQSSFTSRGSGGAITALGSTMQPPPPPPPRSPPVAPPARGGGGMVLSQPPHDVMMAMSGGASPGAMSNIPEDVRIALERQRSGSGNVYSVQGGGAGGARTRYVDTFNHNV